MRSCVKFCRTKLFWVNLVLLNLDSFEIVVILGLNAYTWEQRGLLSKGASLSEGASVGGSFCRKGLLSQGASVRRGFCHPTRKRVTRNLFYTKRFSPFNLQHAVPTKNFFFNFLLSSPQSIFNYFLFFTSAIVAKQSYLQFPVYLKYFNCVRK